MDIYIIDVKYVLYGIVLYHTISKFEVPHGNQPNGFDITVSHLNKTKARYSTGGEYSMVLYHINYLDQQWGMV